MDITKQSLKKKKTPTKINMNGGEIQKSDLVASQGGDNEIPTTNPLVVAVFFSHRHMNQSQDQSFRRSSLCRCTILCLADGEGGVYSMLNKKNEESLQLATQIL